MSKRYPGNFITGNPVALSQTSNNGIWDLKDNYTAVGNGTWQEPDGIYEIPRSLRFRNDGYFSRTPAVTSNRQTWTVSCWAKFSNNNVTRTLFGGGNSATGGGAGFAIGVYSNNAFRFSAGGGVTLNYSFSARKLRDPAAWYHIVAVCDTTNAVPSERVRCFVNGEKITAWGVQTTIPQNNSLDWNAAGTTMYVGAENDAGTIVRHEGYMTEVHSVDGLALDPSYFGYTDSITGTWQPKKYTGAYGTNGFYLPFTEPVATSGTVNPINLGRNFAGGTNYVRYSEDGSQTGQGYTYDRSTNSVNNIIAPNGTLTGNKLTADGTASNTHRFYVGTVATPAGTTQTASIYLKYSNTRYVNIENWNGSNYQTQTFDILNGVPMVGGNAVSAVGFTYQFVGDGWYRVSVPLYAGSANTGGPSIAVYLCDATGNVTWNGDSSSSVYWWGAQINIGTTADPYFKTASSSTITNDWTQNLFSVTAGVTNDSMVDSPTNIFTTATDIGGVVSGNYATLNPLIPFYSGATVYSNSNLGYTVGSNGGVTEEAFATIPVSSGKWYAECTVASVGTNSWIGVCSNVPATATGTYGASVRANGYAYKQSSGNKCNGDNTGVAYGTSFGAGNVIGIALDLDSGSKNITFYRDGVSQGVAFTGLTSTDGNFVFGIDTDPGGSFNWNFGQRAFAYAPPAGFKSLNTTNLQALGTAAVGNAAINPNKYFDISLYSGSGTENAVVLPGGFQPDLTWFKNRSVSQNHHLMDSARGDGVIYYPNLTNTEDSLGSSWARFTSNGLNLGAGAGVNTSGQSYVAWQWKQSPTAGLNIVPYTGTGVARSISHNLGVAPKFMLVKQRDVSIRSWCVYHGGQTDPQQAFYLDSTAGAFSYTAFFNNTAPTSSNFSLGTDASVNQSGSNYVAYIWAEVPGFSKFGRYVARSDGNGPFIYLGFKPKYLLIRSTSGVRDWLIYDTVRTPYNGYSTSDPFAGAHGIIAGVSYTGTPGYSDSIDFVSNGFKFRNAASPNYNGGETYVYVAFAESPFALNNRAI
jgi:hypothetical protein